MSFEVLSSQGGRWYQVKLIVLYQVKLIVLYLILLILVDFSVVKVL
jgi:hypothetical protein